VSSELERLAAACLFPGFEGLRAPDSLRPWLELGIGGVVLFSRNVESLAQVAELTASLRAERSELLVAIDEEGGDVTRLEARNGSSYPGNLALGAVDDVELTERVAGAIAGDLASAGINLDLAPVADVNSNPANPIIGVRAFGSEPALVARHVAAFVRGLQATGVAACAKHFPGHGDTEQDSHLELPTIGVDRETLLARELVPFRAAVDAGVRSIMTAHIRVPALDDAPATLSRAALHGLLREELGFRGLVMTDAIEMRGVSVLGVGEAAVRSLEAGADALCLGHDLGPGEVHRAVVDAVRSGRLQEERLREAAGKGEELAASAARPRAGRDPAVGLGAARRALRVEGDPRIDAAPLVIELWPDPTIAAGPASHGLGDSLRRLDAATEVVRLAAGEGVPDVVGRRPVVLVLRDPHRHAWERETAERVLAAAPHTVVVDVGLPAWRPPGAAAYVATQGAGRVNLDAAAERLLGDGRV
jgi:beta-N-acetylhexosaminidase